MQVNDNKLNPIASKTESLGTRITRNLPTFALLFLIMTVAGYLRFVGIDWDDNTHPHPDERFLTMVETGISLPSSNGEYFDTEFSPLNPKNAGFGFFVYGTFPIILVRYIAEWVSETGYEQVHIVGRMASASFDLISVLLVYMIGANLYRKRVGLLAAAFAALSVLSIQLSHFFVVDPFANTFILLGVYFAIRSSKVGRWWNYLLFGVSLGLATASKANAAPLALVLVIAVVIRIWRADDRSRWQTSIRGFLGLVLGAAVSLIVFRIFQPYAFEGPTFFGILPNELFFSNLLEVSRQQSGAADFPPALQWAMRIPVMFSLKNMVAWGLGFPLGLVSWIGFGWALYRIFRYRELEHSFLVFWVGANFLWRSIGFTQTMRYQLPVYPTIVILGAWALWRVWEIVSADIPSRKQSISKVLSGGSIALILTTTAIWAFSFVNIYQEPNSQVDASRWIYQNVPGSFNLIVEDAGEEFFEPSTLPSTSALVPGIGGSLDLVFKPNVRGQLNSIQLNIAEDSPGMGEDFIISFSLFDDLSASSLVVSTHFEGQITSGNLEIGFNIGAPVELSSGHEYLLRVEMITGKLIELNDQIWARVGTAEGTKNVHVPLPNMFTLLEGQTFHGQIFNKVSGNASAINLPYVGNVLNQTSSIVLEVDLLDPSDDQLVLANAQYSGEISKADERDLILPLDHAIRIEPEKTYEVRFNLKQGTGLTLRGSRIINETSWDMGLPFSVDGRSGFNGLYTGINQELYWPDDEDRNDNEIPDKLERIARSLSEGDFLAIATNRQYGTITRAPSRYPLTTAYYRALLGCHWPDEVLECAARAQLGNVRGELGFELVAVYQSNPQIAGFEINDQLAEEAFTVYDHPKVLIFSKAPSFSAEKVWDLLARVDVSTIDHSAPKDLTTIPTNTQLIDDDFEGQKSEGTWSEFFSRDNIINRYPFLTVLFWWLAISILAIAVFPITRIVFRGLYDGGYPLAKIFALLLLSYGVWFAGSIGISFDRREIFLILLLIVLASAALAWRDRKNLITYFKTNRKTILWTEILALGFFTLDLGIRLGNPDLWHPYKGGEKPMDFSYLNAVLKSSSFPPYDPWFAGGYINYYYYGFVLVGVPIKLLGIVPSTAYNLVIPTLFSTLALGAYSIGYNLFLGLKNSEAVRRLSRARAAGVAAAVALILFGNLGSARLIYEGFQDLGDPTGDRVGFGAAPLNAINGVSDILFKGASLDLSIDRWYWDPSRVIEPGSGEVGPITEFPYFTFLYADLHAHMINMPLTVAALGWGIAWLYAGRGGRKRDPLHYAFSILLGALILGSLRPTNTWDFPTYWTLAGIATLIAPFIHSKKICFRAVIESILSTLFLIGFAYLIFQPYNLWYQQGYTEPERWFGSQTGLNDYLTAHGVFVILIVSWLLWETRVWMSDTPATALRKNQRRILLLVAAFFMMLLIIAILTVQGFGGAPIAFLILIWAGLLIVRPKLAFEKRIVLFLIGTASALTILVEYVRLLGDVGRMNTVFKFYLQAWTLLSLSAAAATAWVYVDINRWKKRWKYSWLGVIGVVVFLAALYPITATPAKIRDRMSNTAPISLDGMIFMESASYYDISGPMPLDEDYRAIQWVQENLSGTPVIVEATTPEYRWGSRFSIYTGLPGVLGWNWHQRQQRGAAAGSSVVDRANAISSFYTKSSIDDALEFLYGNDVDYVIVGRLERQYYENIQPCMEDGTGDGVICDLQGRPMGMQDPDVSPADCEVIDTATDDWNLSCPTFGLVKFELMDQQELLKSVYRDGDTAIYEVVK